MRGSPRTTSTAISVRPATRPASAAIRFADYMGLRLKHIDTTDTGGSSYLVHVGHAAQAIAAGKCNIALITLAGRPRSEGVQTGTNPRMGNPSQPDLQFEFPYGPATANMYAMCAMRHMHQYGTTSRAARLGQGRGLASRAVQSARDAAEGRDRRGSRQLADGGRSAAPARLLRDLGRRRRTDRHQARDRQEPQAAAGQSDRHGRGASSTRWAGRISI